MVYQSVGKRQLCLGSSTRIFKEERWSVEGRARKADAEGGQTEGEGLYTYLRSSAKRSTLRAAYPARAPMIMERVI